MSKDKIEIIKIAVTVVLFISFAFTITLVLDNEFVPIVEGIAKEIKRPLGILLIVFGFFLVYLFFRVANLYNKAQGKAIKLLIYALLAGLGATLLIQAGTKLIVY